MYKIRTSELMEKMIVNSQKSFISEDKSLQAAILKNVYMDNNDAMSLIDVVRLISLNNEYLRISFIKAFCKTLEEYRLLDKDIDIMNKAVSDDILCKAVEKACKEDI